jgi:hypothetical protein
LRTTIDDDNLSLTQIINRIAVCIMLHNLLIGCSYPEGWEVGFEDEIKYEYKEQFIPHDI